MKKSILNIGKALSRAEQKLVFGGSGPCRDSYPNQGTGCKCQRNDQCSSGNCGSSGGGNWWGECSPKAVIME
jgi:hypothetical protein